MLSYLREISFIGLNSIIDEKEYNYANIKLPIFVQELGSRQLHYLKWILTLVFSLAFIGFTYLGILLSMGRKAANWILAIYVMVILFSALFLLISISFVSFKTIYPVLRLMVGIIHSPLLYLLISISFYAISTLNNRNIG